MLGRSDQAERYGALAARTREAFARIFVTGSGRVLGDSPTRDHGRDHRLGAVGQLLLDGRVNPGRMTSFNHYALGAVADWMHRTVAGLAPAAPGYREITVRPLPDRSLAHASARHLTPYGEASVSWRRVDGRSASRWWCPWARGRGHRAGL